MNGMGLFVGLASLHASNVEIKIGKEGFWEYDSSLQRDLKTTGQEIQGDISRNIYMTQKHTN